MTRSPFEFTGPLPPERVTGRDELLSDLRRRISARTVTAMIGPRRFGKSSVLQRLATDLSDVRTIMVDLSRVQAPRDAVCSLMVALLDGEAHVADDAMAVSAMRGFNLIALRGEINSARASDLPDPAMTFALLVDVLVQSALRVPTLLVFDQFQHIIAMPSGTAVLRTALQHHYQDIGLLFAGSPPAAMLPHFAHYDAPFMHQADLIEIEPLSLEATKDLVDGGFAETNRLPGTVASLVHAFTHGHPLRTMQVAHAAWQQAESLPADTGWGDALAAVRRTASPSMASMYELLPTTQQKALRIVASGGSVYGTAARILGLSKGGAQQASSSLLNAGHLTMDDRERPSIGDPILADWLQLAHPL